MSPALTGGCNCGAVRFEITEPLFGARYCHCTRCQRRTGTAASADAAVVPGSFRIANGEAALKVWIPPDGNEKWFCGECGSAIFTRGPTDDAKTGVRLGAPLPGRRSRTTGCRATPSARPPEQADPREGDAADRPG